MQAPPDLAPAPPSPTPEGTLIGEALDASVPHLSLRELGRRAGLSYGRVRQIIKGYINVSPGVYTPLPPAPALAVAKICAAEGMNITHAQLIDAGRPDAADELTKLMRRRPVAAVPALAVTPEDSDEAAVWAIVKGHKPGTSGEELFGEGTYEARCWNGLVSENFTIEQIVPVIAWWMRHPLPGDAREREHTDQRAAS